MFDLEEGAAATGSTKPEGGYGFVVTASEAAVKTGDIQEGEEVAGARVRFRKPAEHIAEDDTTHPSGGQTVYRSHSEEGEFVVETAYGTVEEVFEDKVNILLDLYGQKKVHGFSLEALKRRGITSLRRNDAVRLEAVFRNGRIEGRLVGLGSRPETTVEKKRFPLGEEYFLEQDA